MLKGQAGAGGFRCRSSILVQSALEQPVLLDGASWSCTRPSQRCGATTMQSMQTVQSMQFLAQEAKPRSRAAVRSRMRRSRYNEHDAGSKRPGRLCGARMLNPTRTPHERAQEASRRRAVRDAHRRRVLQRQDLAPIHSFRPCFRSDAKGNNNLVSQVDRLARPGRAQAAQGQDVHRLHKLASLRLRQVYAHLLRGRFDAACINHTFLSLTILHKPR